MQLDSSVIDSKIRLRSYILLDFELCISETISSLLDSMDDLD